ncbi:MAG: DUF3311 domain-containing protein [Gemmatimonadetes bacterium]|nr:DUF3311 domain-containing protein [Gemmatimonadota bacterium]
MRARTARRLAIAFFALYALVLTYPGVLPFNRIRPLVFGLPFIMFWVALWVALAGVTLWLTHLAARRERRGR